MKKKLYFLLITMFFIPLLLYPCRCNEVTVEEAVEYSDIVIKGKVLSVTKFRDYEGQGLKIDTTGLDEDFKRYKSFAPLFLVSLKVENVYKGENVSDTISIITPVQSRTCGYQHFETGIDMIIYGTYKFPLLGVMSISSAFPIPISELPVNHFWTNHCIRTIYWHKEEENNILQTLQIKQ